MTDTTTTAVRNGIDADALMATIEATTDGPAVGAFASPVRDIVTNAVPVSTSIEVV